MTVDHRLKLTQIKRFDQLIAYLRDEMGWPIARDSFDDVDDLFYEFSAEELGIDPKTSAKILEIKRLRPLSPKQPWGIFFVKFEPKKLPVIALRRILGQVALKRLASANSPDRTAWSADDLLFISNYGDGDARQISFAHFSKSESSLDLPTLRVLGWNNLDTGLHLDAVAKELTENLTWPEEGGDLNQWRKSWSDAFKLGHNEVINTAKDLSIRLAELASSIRDRIKVALIIENDSGPLKILMNAFRSSLVHDLDDDSFADMYAQTIAYGLLSARITDPSKKTVDDFTSHMRTSPFLRELMETFLKVGGRKGKTGGPGIDFDELGVGDVIQLLDNVNIEAVLRDFGDKNQQEDPVMHFFEGFLHAYDKKIRKDRGVFYTPQPIVSFIVRSVHELLQTEFGLIDGLADVTTWGEMLGRHAGLTIPLLTDLPGEKRYVSRDEPFVQILDPATGTATFIVEVIEVIFQTVTVKWKRQKLSDKQINKAWNEYVPKHLLPRLHAFELMMAPYAIAHMKVSLKLAETGYLFDTDDRARVYLANALEPWVIQPNLLGFDALANEAAAVNEIKLRKKFTVILGNPPYSGHSLNNQVAWIVDKIHEFKRGYPDLQKPGQSKWLQDDYVKFLRYSDWQLSLSSVGVIGFITNNAWLDNPTFKGMRKHFLNFFDQISILDLHGNANKSERSIDGGADKNVFEIKQGVSISFLLRNLNHEIKANRLVSRSDIFGSKLSKFEILEKNTIKEIPCKKFLPLPPELIFSDIDSDLKSEYDAYIPISKIMGENGDPAPGIVTTHDDFAISFSKKDQIDKIQLFLNTKTETDARNNFKLCSQSQWIYKDAKQALQTSDWRKQLREILYRPFDTRWTVYNRYVSVHRRERVSTHLLSGSSIALITCRQRSVQDEWAQVFCTTLPIESTSISNKTKEINYVFPLWLTNPESINKIQPNLSPNSLRSISESTGLSLINLKNDEVIDFGDLVSTFGPRDIFNFVYAILHSHSYRNRYKDFLKSDFPRIPMACDKELFCLLAKKGRELSCLHLLDLPKSSAPIAVFTGSRDPFIEKISWSKNTVWLDKSETIGFQGVHENVWNFHVGGYQVCEKWLKDRKGRTLSLNEITHYENIVYSLSYSILIMSEIDEAIDKNGGWPGAFI